MIDDMDRRILHFLQENGRVSNAEVARRVGMAPSAVLERIRKLEDRGVIQGYQALLDPRAIGCGLLAFIYVRADELPGCAETGTRLSEIPGVLEVHHIAGEDCYLAKVRAADTDHLAQLLRDSFGGIPTVRSTRTTIVLNTLKDDPRLPLNLDPASPEVAG